MLGLLDSWDSSDGAGDSPDYLDVYIDGFLVASLTAKNAQGTINNFYGATIIAYEPQVDGHSHGTYPDYLIDLGTASFASFAHVGTTLTVGFQASGAGWQGGGDESWGLDSFSIEYDAAAAAAPAAEPAAPAAPPAAAVPEPATMTIWGLGAIGCAVAAYRRKRLAT